MQNKKNIKCCMLQKAMIGFSFAPLAYLCP